MRRFLLIAAGLLVVLFGAAWWYALYTNAGVNFVLARLSSLRSVRIVVDEVQGHLAGPLTIKHIMIDHKLVHVDVDNVRLELSPSAIFFGTVKIDALTATRASVDVKLPTDNQPTTTFFSSFLQLAANHIDIHDAHVTVGDGFIQVANRVQGRVRLTARRLQVDDLLVDAPAYSAAGMVTVSAQKPIALQVNARINTPASRGPMFDTKIALSGPIDKLAVDAELIAPAAAQLRGEISRAANVWQLRGKLTSENFRFDSWLQNPPFSLRNLAMDIDGSPDNIHLAGAVVVPEVDALPLQLDLHGQYANRIIAITRGDLRATKSDLSIRTAARIDMTESKPTVAATAQWANFRWPIRANYFVSPQGQLSLSGSLPFNIGVNADVRTQYDVSGHVLAHGLLSDASIEFDDATLNALDGEIKGTASLNFSTAREWRVAATGRNINPKSINAQLPGNIEFKIDASGAGLDLRAEFAITLP
ncbi:MAG TPA: hypothetical protein VET48_09150 [Steroidobacteraceae bacterium]|nr:hypothetical protein [Steroidobacteraceae bacterium]